MTGITRKSGPKKRHGAKKGEKSRGFTKGEEEGERKVIIGILLVVGGRATTWQGKKTARRAVVRRLKKGRSNPLHA